MSKGCGAGVVVVGEGTVKDERWSQETTEVFAMWTVKQRAKGDCRAPTIHDGFERC